MSEYEATPSYVHRQRGRCCKCSCLHCPYGHTIKTLGFQLEDINDKTAELVRTCLDFNQSSGVAAMLLSQAFKSEPVYKMTDENQQKFKAIYLKEHFCGCLYLDQEDKKLFLMPNFQDQGIKIEDVLVYIS